MAHKTLIGGTAYEVKGGRCLVDGTGYSIKKGRTLVDGTGYDISFASGVALADLAEGSVVYINESGSPVEFYVACHNYESDLNGTGRTLLVRKTGHSEQAWDEAQEVLSFPESDIYAWLNGTYKALLDASVQAAMGTTKYKNTAIVTSGSTNTAAETKESSSVFLVSSGEVLPASFWEENGITNSFGSILPVAEILFEGQETWSRSPVVLLFGETGAIKNAEQAIGLTADKANIFFALLTNSYPVYPCFTLPSDSLFDENMEFVPQKTTDEGTVTVEITGEGSAESGYVTVDGVHYTGAASGMKVDNGDVITMNFPSMAKIITPDGASGYYSGGTPVDWTVPDGVSHITINMATTSETLTTFTITTS